MTQDMDTFGARLASFDLVLQPEKRRGSSAKTAKAIAWPHRRPSPAELAHAGFFYNPYETNPDNTTCFLCRRALDGWEEEDNPITEHLKHSPDCGWALMMDIQQHSSNPAEIEDPTSETIRQARMATFGEVWPHDGKRGWVCQSEKMVDGGWYFCPTEESDDLASCAYCKLSLDGWEPKDDPFDEHYRRSSDCSFFVFALPGGKKTKASRSKKARTSKVSRQSTQSVSEAPVSDLEVIEPPAMAQPTTKSKSTKKSSKSKTKTSKSKKAEPEPVPTETEVDNGEQPQPEVPQPKRATRGKKRASEADPDQENSATNIQETEHAEAPTKKKAKKSRESAQESGGQDLVIADVQQEEDVGREPQEPQEQEEPKKTRGTSKKKASAKLRKASSVSSTAKQTAKHEEPEDVDMYAALEAELYNAGPSQSNEEVEQKPAKKSKSKKKKKNASPEPPAEAVGPVEEPHQDAPQETETTESPAPEEPVQPKTKRESSKREKPRGRSSSKRVTEEPSEPTQPAEPAEPAQPASEIAFEMDDARDVDVSRHESFVSVEITSKLPEEEPPAEPSDKETKKKQKKKSSLEKSKKPKKSSKTAPEPIQSVEEQVEERAEEPKAEEVQPQEPSKPHETQEVQEQEPDPQPPRRRSSRVPPKTAERYSDILEEKQYAKSLASSRSSGARAAPEEDTKRDDPEAVSPIPSASKSTPSLSPQSSDAENQPPSMKPSASRPVAVSPSKQSSFRVPLAPSTPSPSKRAANAGGLTTSHPWKPVDIDEILFASNSDKENIDITSALNSVKGDLTSPEKKMTVEQWITWNAKDGEERLRRECERLVGQFEKEGARAMHVLEGIECMD